MSLKWLIFCFTKGDKEEEWLKTLVRKLHIEYGLVLACKVEQQIQCANTAFVFLCLAE